MEITQENFDSQVMQASGLVVLDCWATWCGPCKMLAPVMDALEARFPQVKFGKINVDEQPALADAFRVDSIPSLFFLKEGKVLSQMVGYQDETALAAAITELLK